MNATTRRHFIQSSTVLLAGAACRMPSLLAAKDGLHSGLALPMPGQRVWQDCEVGLLYSFGRNCNLIIGAVIKPDGSFPEADAKRFAEFGAEIKRRYGKPVAEIKGDGAVIELGLTAPRQLDAMIAMEDIAHGERVREYVLEGRVPGGGWEQLGTGQSIGHKRIQGFERQEFAAVRLRLTKSVAEPRIRRFAVCDTVA